MNRGRLATSPHRMRVTKIRVSRSQQTKNHRLAPLSACFGRRASMRASLCNTGRCDDRQAVPAPMVDTCRRAHLIRHMLINLMLIVVKTQCL
jgi:hypothetical protein